MRASAKEWKTPALMMALAVVFSACGGSSSSTAPKRHPTATPTPTATATLTAIATPTSTPTPAVPAPWPMFHHDPKHTGLSPVDTSADIGAQKWTFATGGGMSSPAVGADGTIYVGSLDFNVYALNPDGTRSGTSPPAIGCGPRRRSERTGRSTSARLTATSTRCTERQLRTCD